MVADCLRIFFLYFPGNNDSMSSLLGFINITVQDKAGSLLASGCHSFWNWDPLEIRYFFLQLQYPVFMHVKLTMSIKFVLRFAFFLGQDS